MTEDPRHSAPIRPIEEPKGASTAAGDKPPRSGLLIISIVGVVILLGVLAIGYVSRTSRARALTAAASDRRNAIPQVNVYVVRPGSAASPLVEPGNIEPITEAVIYARIDGYITERLVDIGDRVQTGQLLAVISSPERDEELRTAEEALQQSKSDVETAKAAIDAAKANLFIADVTNRRWQDLLTRNVVSQQEADTTESAYLARKADLTAAEAKQRTAQAAVGANEHRVQRLKELISYERVVAPFPGIITQRNIDIGSLASAGSSASVPALYHLARLDRMRIFVDVPQSDSNHVRVGQSCTVQVREFGTREFAAAVTRFASSIDVASRTMRTEVQIPNPRGDLLPGTYATVRFNFTRKQPQILIPADTLVASPAGDRVVAVRDKVAHFETIRVATDFGAQLEVLEGVKIGDSLIRNVTDDIREGTKVQMVAPTGTEK